MKLISLILLSFTLLLAISPCSDYDCDETELISHSDDHNSDDHSQDSNDGCTAFCICSCCGGFVSNLKVIILPADNILAFDTNESIYKESYSIQSLDNIFHPPKI